MNGVIHRPSNHIAVTQDVSKDHQGVKRELRRERRQAFARLSSATARRK